MIDAAMEGEEPRVTAPIVSCDHWQARCIASSVESSGVLVQHVHRCGIHGLFWHRIHLVSIIPIAITGVLAVAYGACPGSEPRSWCQQGVEATAGDGLCCPKATTAAPEICNSDNVLKNMTCQKPGDVACWIPIRGRTCVPFNKTKSFLHKAYNFSQYKVPCGLPDLPNLRMCKDVTDSEHCNPCSRLDSGYCCNDQIGECRNVDSTTVWIATPFFALVYFLGPYRLLSPAIWHVWRGTVPRKLAWPSTAFVKERLVERLGPDYDHLKLGMTRYAMRDALIWILPGYRRTQDWIVNKVEIVGHDLQHAIEEALREHDLQEFSIAEIMFALGHPGVCFATVFFSHTQAETVMDTLMACRNFAEAFSLSLRILWLEPYIWLDYFALRQCKSDFTFDSVKKTIKAIGHTVLVAENMTSTPKAAQRSFCGFEIHATLSRPRKQLSAATVEQPSILDLMRGRLEAPQIEIQWQFAECRKPEHRQQILDKLSEAPGIKDANDASVEALKGAFHTIRNGHIMGFGISISYWIVFWLTFWMNTKYLLAMCSPE